MFLIWFLRVVLLVLRTMRISDTSYYVPVVVGVLVLAVAMGCVSRDVSMMGMEQAPSDRREEPTHYEVSAAGVTLLKKFEGLRKHPYMCPAGVLTVGYGQCISSQATFHALYPHGFSEQDAHDLLRKKLMEVYVPDVKRLVQVPLAQREFDALVSLNYNIGATVLHEPTKYVSYRGKEIALLPLLNAACYKAAACEFPKFTKGGPEKSYYRGILKRRMTEMYIFRGSSSMPMALRLPVEDDNFRKITKCDSIATYWEESAQESLRDEALSLYKAYNAQLETYNSATHAAIK